MEIAQLRSLPYLADLTETELAPVAASSRQLSFERGGRVLDEGEPCLGLYFVISGRVKIFKLSIEGREQILRVMGPGETFNEVPAIDGGPNPASVEAMEPSAIGLVPRAEFEHALKASPALSWKLLQQFAGRLRVFVELVAELSLMSIEERLARLLLLSSQGSREPLRVTQQEMAAMAGTTREVAARALRSLEERGAIRRTEGRVEVVDPAALAAAAQGIQGRTAAPPAV